MTTPAETPSHPQPHEEKASSRTTPGQPTELNPTSPTSGATPISTPQGANPFLGYDIVGELGRGGMGVVYKAFDRKRQRTVALKTMQGIDARSLLRFKQEFRSLAGLSHANLVTLFELIGDDLQWFFTMELIEGVSFLHYVRGSPASGPQKTLTDVRYEGMAARGWSSPLGPDGLQRLRLALAQLAAGVCFLHESGKLHRDIKPGNVLVTPQGRTVLLDFGLATDIDRNQRHQSGRLLGTIAYMAPEQAARQPVSPASDWYSVGVMLYEALTGSLPFDGDSYEILHHKQFSDPPTPTTVAQGTAEDLSILCMELLRRDPQTRPTGGEVLRRLSESASAHPVAFSLPEPKFPRGESTAQRLEVPLIGRQQHLQLLAQALEQTRSGRTVLVEVHGRSGAGKSALLQRFLSDLRDEAEAVILMGRCFEQESVPYKALDSLVDALSGYLERLPASEAQVLWPRDLAALMRVFPVLRRVDASAAVPRRATDTSDPQEVRRRALAALRELLARLGDRRPLILAIDDLQWGDEDSAALLTDLLRPPDPPVLLLALCYRREDSQSSPCLRALPTIRDLGGLERYEVPVEPLTLEERRELALALLDPHDEMAAEQAERIAQQSGGYPFFVYELVQYLKALEKREEKGEIRDQESPIRSSVFRVPSRESGDISLSEVLWSRIVALPDEARRLLEVVSVARQPLAQADACRAADIADEHAVLAALRAGRFLRSAGSSASCHPEKGEEKKGAAIETYHDRIRETVLLNLDAPTLRRHHQRLVAVMQEGGQTDPEVLAVHLVGAGEKSRAGHYYVLAAAQAAETLAFDRAAKLYRLALELLEPEGEEERRLRTKLGDALADAGRGAESALAYLSATSGADAAEGLELQRKAALQFLRGGHIDDGLATLRTVLSAVGMKLLPTPRRAFWALVWQRLRLMVRGLHFRPRPLDRINAADLTRLDVCQSAAIGLSMVDTLQGAYFQTRSSLLALKLGERERLVTALAMEAAHASVGGSRGRRRTQRYLDTVEPLALQVDRPYARAVAALASGIAAALAGEWRDGQQRCDEAERILRNSCIGALWELGTAHRFALWPLMFMGDVVEINRRLPRLLQEARQRDDLYEETNLCLGIRTFVHLAADDPERARGELAQVMDKWSQQGFHVQHMNRLFDDVQIDLYEGDAERAWHRLAEAWPALQRSYLLHVQQVRIVMLDLRARCALARAVSKDSVSWLRHAARDARALRREKALWADALARLVEAAIAYRDGDADRSTEILNAAIAGFSTTHMHLHSSVARRRLGQVLGGSQGRQLVNQAQEWMNGQTIHNRERMTALLAPGWCDENKATEITG